MRLANSAIAHSAVVRFPGDHYMVYDAGHWMGQGTTAFDGILYVVAAGAEIDLLVLSHSDADHLGAVKRITDAFEVKRIIHGGLERVESATWRRADEAISSEQSAGARVINLKHDELPPGATYRLGDGFATVIAGFYAPPDDWDIHGDPEGSEFTNAGSIVVRVLYAGRSVLLTGDAVGRHIGDPSDALIATEKFMIEMSPAVSIDSDVLIAPHHGADNASSTAFIEAVSPEWVVFPSGNRYKHPRESTADRFLDHGVPLDRIFRTDFGDDEGEDEWDHGRLPGSTDPARDDDVEIVIHESGTIDVRYARRQNRLR